MEKNNITSSNDSREVESVQNSNIPISNPDEFNDLMLPNTQSLSIPLLYEKNATNTNSEVFSTSIELSKSDDAGTVSNLSEIKDRTSKPYRINIRTSIIDDKS